MPNIKRKTTRYSTYSLTVPWLKPAGTAERDLLEQSTWTAFSGPKQSQDAEQGVYSGVVEDSSPMQISAHITSKQSSKRI